MTNGVILKEWLVVLVLITFCGYANAQSKEVDLKADIVNPKCSENGSVLVGFYMKTSEVEQAQVAGATIRFKLENSAYAELYSQEFEASSVTIRLNNNTWSYGFTNPVSRGAAGIITKYNWSLIGVLRVERTDASLPVTVDLMVCKENDFPCSYASEYYMEDGNQITQPFTLDEHINFEGSCNSKPQAINDSFFIEQDSSFIENVLLNDLDEDSLSAVVIKEPVHAKYWSFHPSGDFEYIAREKFIGSDSIIYEVCDDNSYVLCDTGIVIVHIQSIDGNCDSFRIDAGANHFVCGNDEVELGGEVVADGGSGNYVYSWEPANLLNDSDEMRPIYKATSNVVFTLTVDDGHCYSSDLVEIAVDDNCVWPGDVNNNGVVNLFDLLYLGRLAGLSGVERSDQSLDWYSHPAKNWARVFNYGTNSKHGDVDGNGKIDQRDVEGILMNYGKTYNGKVGVAVNNEENNPPIFVELPDTTYPSELIVAPINYGSAEEPIEEGYGVVFTIEIDEELIVPGSLSFSTDSSWLGVKNKDLVAMSYSISNNIIQVGLTRFDQKPINKAFGPIGIIQFIIEDDLGGKGNQANVLEAKISQVMMSNSEIISESISPINSKSVVGVRKYPKTTISNELLLEVFPIPTKGLLHVKIDSNSVLFNSVFEIYNIQGKLLHQGVMSNTSFQLDVSGYSQGSYVISFITNAGNFNRQFIVSD